MKNDFNENVTYNILFKERKMHFLKRLLTGGGRIISFLSGGAL